MPAASASHPSMAVHGENDSEINGAQGMSRKAIGPLPCRNCRTVCRSLKASLRFPPLRKDCCATASKTRPRKLSSNIRPTRTSRRDRMNSRKP